jgi:hypothetical protein
MPDKEMKPELMPYLFFKPFNQRSGNRPSKIRSASSYKAGLPYLFARSAFEVKSSFFASVLFAIISI